METKKKNKATILLNVKVTSGERKALLQAARRYASGNLSAWIRFAGLHFVPKRSQLRRTA